MVRLRRPCERLHPPDPRSTLGRAVPFSGGLLDRFEDRLDRIVNGAFAKAFKSEVQPVELAAALQKEMDDRAAIVARGRTVTPNIFTIDLSPHDDERLSVYRDALQGELGTVVTEYAAEQGYSLLGPAEVKLTLDDTLDTGIFRVHSEARAAVTSAAAADALPGQPYLEIGARRYPLVRLSRDSGAVTRQTCASKTPVSPAAIARSCWALPPSRVTSDPPTARRSTDRVGQAALVDGSVIVIGTTSITYRTG